MDNTFKLVLKNIRIVMPKQSPMRGTVLQVGEASTEVSFKCGEEIGKTIIELVERMVNKL